MRFRAKFSKDALPGFLGVVSALSKFTKTQKLDDIASCIKLTNIKIYISVRNVDHIEAYSEFSTNEIFLPGYFLESKRENQIALAFQVSNFYDALKSGSICDEINIKLSQRDGQAVLSFEFHDPSLQTLLITQDCPVQPLTGNYFEAATVPEIPPCEWNIELPKTKSILNILSHLQKIGSDTLQLEVKKVNTEKNDCEIEISSGSSLVNINTRITHCKMYIKSTEPNFSSVQRLFKTRRIQSALKVAYDSSMISGQPKLIMLAIPNNQETDPWMCILSSINSLETGLLTCVIPSQIEYT